MQNIQLENFSTRITEPLGPNILNEATNRAIHVNSAVRRFKEESSTQGQVSSVDFRLYQDIQWLTEWRCATLYHMLKNHPTISEEQLQNALVFAQSRDKDVLLTHLQRVAINYALLQRPLYSAADRHFLPSQQTMKDLDQPIDFVTKTTRGELVATKIVGLLDQTEFSDPLTPALLFTSEKVQAEKQVLTYAEKNQVVQTVAALAQGKTLSMSKNQQEMLQDLTVDDLNYLFGYISIDEADLGEEDRELFLGEVREMLNNIISRNTNAPKLPAEQYVQVRTLFTYLGAYDDLQKMAEGAGNTITPRILYVPVFDNEPFIERLLPRLQQAAIRELVQ